MPQIRLLYSLTICNAGFRPQFPNAIAASIKICNAGFRPQFPNVIAALINKKAIDFVTEYKTVLIRRTRMASNKVMKLASEGKRFGAACIDTIIPFIAYMIFIAGIGKLVASRRTPSFGYGFDNDFGFGYGYNYNYGYGASHSSTGAVVAILIGLLLLLAYFIVECVFYAKSQSIGKAILGMQVVSSKDGRPVGFWKMLLRECIVKQADNVILLGYIWILIDDKNRAWHDKILDTYVVDLKESEKMHIRRDLEHAEGMAYRAERANAALTGAAEAEARAAAEAELHENATAATELRENEAAATEPQFESVEAVTDAKFRIADDAAAEETGAAEGAAASEKDTEASDSDPNGDALIIDISADIAADIEEAAEEEAASEEPAAAMPKRPVIRLDLDDETDK